MLYSVSRGRGGGDHMQDAADKAANAACLPPDLGLIILQHGQQQKKTNHSLCMPCPVQSICAVCSLLATINVCSKLHLAGSSKAGLCSAGRWGPAWPEAAPPEERQHSQPGLHCHKPGRHAKQQPEAQPAAYAEEWTHKHRQLAEIISRRAK